MKQFCQWVMKNFGCEPPPELLAYLKDNPDGSSGSDGSLFGYEDIVTYTEERNLAQKGVLYIGAGVSLDVFLIRAIDGKVFLVDENDFQSVDASFKHLSKCTDLLNIQ